MNPPQGYIVTANNRVVGDDYPYDLGREMLMGDRAKRIVELIEDRDRVDVAYIRQMHFDQVSPIARLVAARLADLAVDDPELAAFVQRMREWDGRLAADSGPAAVHEIFVRTLLKLVLTPKLAVADGQPDLVPQLIGSDRLWHWLVRLLDQPDPYWFDLGRGETRDEVMRLALRQTVDTLKQELGPDFEGWAWGKLHRLTYYHPMGEVPALAPFFNRGPYPLGGDGTTVWCAAPESSDPKATKTVGPPYRMIVDLGDLRQSVSLLAPGQSGLPGTAHYDDQAAAWHAGGYHPMLFAREDVEREVRHRLRLTPANP